MMADDLVISKTSSVRNKELDVASLTKEDELKGKAVVMTPFILVMFPSLEVLGLIVECEGATTDVVVRLGITKKLFSGVPFDELDKVLCTFESDVEDTVVTVS
jgi:hypothetical protein